jgi:hypothetical protein
LDVIVFMYIPFPHRCRGPRPLAVVEQDVGHRDALVARQAARFPLATSAGRSARGGTRSASRTGRRPSRLGVLLRAGLAHPFAAVRVPGQVQEPLQKACTIAPAKPWVTALCASAAANSLGDAWPRRSASAMTWATAARCGPADCLIRDRDSHLTAVFADRTDLVLSVVARRVSSQPITGAEYCAAEY